jgi:hypothetical protein
MNEADGEESPSCPVCRSERGTRAVVLRGDYRCPDCSALFDVDERIVADPRPWVEPRATGNRPISSGPAADEPDERSEPPKGRRSKRTT